MNFKFLAIFIASLFTATLLADAPPASAPATQRATFVAVHASHPIEITGRLDDPIWSAATAYPMNAMNDDEGRRMTLHEGGKVRFAWDDKFLYLAADFTESDVTTKADKDGIHAYRFGDVCELFLQPVGSSCYWELYVTPNNHQTTFLWPAPGQRPPSALQKVNRLIVTAHVDGTLNDSGDRDRGWTAQMAVPWEMLKFQGKQFGPHNEWHALVGRYNYSKYLPELEYSSAPAISKRSYHLTGEYATLELEQGK